MIDGEMSFGRLIISPFNGGRFAYVAKDYVVYWKGMPGLPDSLMTVHRGFITDFASVPRFLWGVVPPHFYPHASVLHDWLYSIQWKDSRALCDLAFRTALIQLGARPFHWLACYYGVRLGGGFFWKAKDLSDVEAWRRGPRRDLQFPGDVRGGPTVRQAHPPLDGIWGRP